MNLAIRRNWYRPPQFQGATVLGTTQTYALDQTYPLEEILLVVDMVINGTAITFPTTPQTPQALDNIYSVVQNVTLAVNDSTQPRNVINYSGIGLLELCSKLGVACDPGTLMPLTATTQGANTNLRLVYRIPCVNPILGEDLRTRNLLPIHLYQQPPQLTITFGTAANIGTGGAIGAMNVTVILNRRAFPTVGTASLTGQQVVEAQIAAKGGYLKWDLVESQFNIPLGNTAPIRVPLVLPGEYACLLVRHYLGGANMTRACVDLSGTGGGTATASVPVQGFGNETAWTLETGGLTLHAFRWKDIQLANYYSRSVNSTTMSSSPDFAGAPLTSCNFPSPASIMFDFLGDSVGGGDITELGSVLDCNSVSAKNQKMELVGQPSSAATNSSVLFYGGYRYLGDISPFQTFN